MSKGRSAWQRERRDRWAHERRWQVPTRWWCFWTGIAVGSVIGAGLALWQ